MSIAPFPFQRLETRPDIPQSGRFILPICITRDELLALVSAVERYMRFTGIWDVDALWPLLQAIEYIGRPEMAGCYDGAYEGKDCLSYPAFASFIEYLPDDPFVDDPVPPNYANHAWWAWGNLDTALPDWIDNPIGDLIDFLTQYRQNDALVWLGSLPVYTSIGDLLEYIIGKDFPFPYAKIYVKGKGSIRIQMLSFPFGGRVVVEVDQFPNILDIISNSIIDPDSRVIDTDRDVTSFPIEQWPEIGVKLEIEEEGEHVVYVIPLPRINDGIDFFGYGAGIRSVELCGGLQPSGAPEQPPPPPLEGVSELRPEFQFTPECGFEYRLRDQNNAIVQDWQAISGWDENAFNCFVGAIEMPTTEEICAGVICALEQAASRFLSGEAGNTIGGVTINPDGTITIGEGSGGGLGDAAEIKDGGIANMKLAYQKFFTDINTWRNAAVGITAIKDRVKAAYLVDDVAMDSALNAWDAAFPNPTSVLYTFPSDTTQIWYCSGHSQAQIAQFFIDKNPSPLAYILTIHAAFLPEQFTVWYEAGTDTPATDYITYPCTPMPDEDLILEINGANGNTATTNTQKTNHRLLFEVSGKVQHPTESDRYFDFFYENDGGVVTYRGGVNISRFGGGIDEPSQSKVPYMPDGNYRFTLDITAGSGVVSISKNLVSGFPAVDTIGEFSIKIKDFGQVSL